MEHKSDFESDATCQVFENITFKIRFLCHSQNLENSAKHYQLAIRSQDELLVLDAKSFLDTCSVTNWTYYKDGLKWIQALETIYRKSSNVREQYYALQVLNSVRWAVNDKKAASKVVSSVQTRYKAADRNPQRRWKDSVLTEQNVPSRKGLIRLSRMVILSLGTPLPQGVCRKILSFC
jgi:hypothetical protein